MSSACSFRNRDIVKIAANGGSWCLLLDVNHPLNFSSHRAPDSSHKVTCFADYRKNRSTGKCQCGFVRIT